MYTARLVSGFGVHIPSASSAKRLTWKFWPPDLQLRLQVYAMHDPHSLGHGAETQVVENVFSLVNNSAV